MGSRRTHVASCCLPNRLLNPTHSPFCWLTSFATYSMDGPTTQPPSEAAQPPLPLPAEPNRPTVNKHDDHLQRKKAAALQKLDKVRQSFEKQLATLTQQQERDRHSAQLIEANTAAADAAIASINVEVARGTDWTELQRILKDERDKGNPIARMIVALDLHTNTVTLALSQSMAHVRAEWVDSGREEDRVEEVELDLSQSAYNNASSYYTQRKQQGVKVNKTTETSERALRAVERRTAQQLKDSDVRARIQQARRSYWFEKYHWFVTSENFLVISGRDAQQSQLIAQRHLAPSDVYVCADVSGAVGVIVKNSTAAAVPPLSVQQAACMCLCRSTAWMGKPGSSGGEAWWVGGEEVEVASEGGRVAVKSGAVRRYVTRMPLVMGLAVLFRVTDECVAAHKGERRIKGGVFEERKGGEKRDEEGKEEEEEDETEEEEHGEERDGDGDDEKAERDDEDEDDEGDEEDTQQTEEQRGKQHSSGPSTAALKNAADVLTSAVKGMSLRGADVTTAAGQLDAASEDDTKTEADGQPSHPERQKKKSSSTKSAKRRVSAADKRKGKKAEDHSTTGSANSVSADDDNSSEDHSASRAASRQQPDKANKVAKPAAAQLTRAQRAKMKKLAKYADQDEEDRSIAAQVLGLQTPKRRDSSNKQHKEQREDETEEADQREDGEQNKIDAAVVSLAVTGAASATTPIKPATAATVDSANIICRGCKKKGHAYRDCPDRPQSTPTQQRDEMTTDDQPTGYPLDLIDALTGRPLESDQLQFALCVCAPYSALIDYKYRVKLLPGSQKKGKVVQAAVSLWTRAAGGRDAERDMIRGTREDEAMGVLCANVKIAAGMAGAKDKKRRKEGGGKEAAD